MSDEIKDIDNAVLGYKPRQKTDRKKYLKEWRGRDMPYGDPALSLAMKQAREADDTVSDLVSLGNQSQDEPLKSATPDIDTQIESLVEQMCMHSQKAPDGTVTVIYEGLSPKAAHKAIKTLLIQSIDDALANQATPTASGKQVGKSSSGAYHDGYRDGYQTAKHEALQKFENENYQ